jgi:hypothetical protein
LESLGSLLALADLEDVETDSLGKRTALTNSDKITTILMNKKGGMQVISKPG